MGGDVVLVIDDDVDVRRAVAQVLEDEGYQVVVASGGRPALELVRGGVRPRVMLLDICMPDMDGWHFLSARLRLPELAAVPVVIFSAVPQAVIDAHKVGAAAVIAKPFHLEDLLSAIKECWEDVAVAAGAEVSTPIERSSAH
jgi:CheY-like chemotaxis protein